MTGLSFLKGTRALVKSFIARVTSDGGIIEAAKCIGDLDADLVMQPSGYEAETLYSQKPVPVYGSELVINGDFATDSDWSKGTGWSISGGLANHIGSQSLIGQSNILTIGNKYRLTFEISGSDGSSHIRILSSQYTNGDNYYDNGKVIIEIIPNIDHLYIYAIGEVSIDNVSVKEVLTGSGDFTVDRNSTATRVNSLGLIESVAANVPRLDYTDGNCPSLLLEQQGTNLFIDGDDVASSQGVSNATISQNIVTSPKGDLSGARFTENTSTGLHFARIGSVTSGESTISIFAKAEGRNRILLSKDFTNGVRFNLSSGIIDSYLGVGYTATIKSYGNEWYRITVTTTLSSGGTFYVLTLKDDSDNINYTGDGSSSVLLYGAQLEQSSVATSYIPTNGSTVTRLADVVGKTGISDFIGQSEGSIFFDCKSEFNSLSRDISISDGTLNNRISMGFLSSDTRFSLQVIKNGVTQVSSTFITVDQSINNKIALSYKQNNFKLFINGVLSFTDTSGDTFNGNTLDRLLFERGNGQNFYTGKTKDLRVYKTALTDERLIYITGTLNENYYNTYFDMSNALNYTPQ